MATYKLRTSWPGHTMGTELTLVGEYYQSGDGKLKACRSLVETDKLLFSEVVSLKTNDVYYVPRLDGTVATISFKVSDAVNDSVFYSLDTCQKAADAILALLKTLPKK